MKLSTSDEGSTIVFEIRGALEGKSVEQFSSACSEAVTSGRANIKINMHSVGMVDSAGLEALLECQERCKSAGGTCVLVDVSPKVLKILEITRLDRELAVA